MLLSKLFESEFIKIGLKAEDKEEAFKELTEAFCKASRLEIHEEILEAVRERERKMSTGIQKGIAVPHGRVASIDKVYGILGISHEGIDYDALDDKPVYLIFLILAPRKETEYHLRILKQLAELLKNPDFFTDLASQNDPSRANGIIKKYETSITVAG